MPIPESLTETFARVKSDFVSVERLTEMFPPFGVNLKALLSRLLMIFSNLSLSTIATADSVSDPKLKLMFFVLPMAGSYQSRT